MADSVQNIKKRIKSVNNINKITKAMELVAATKMRRAQEIAIASRPYAFAALNLLANVSLFSKDLPPLLKKRIVKKTLFVLVASDKGLAGAFNSSLFKKFDQFISQKGSSPIVRTIGLENEERVFAAVGEKAYQYLVKKRYSVVQKFISVGDYTTVEQVKPLAEFLMRGYFKKKWDRVIIFSSHFRSALKQEPIIKEILPVSFKSIKQTVEETVPETGKFAELIEEQNISFVPEKNLNHEYLIEPSSSAVLELLSEHLVFMQIYHLILEANASEHSARRLAMKTASDNASDLGEKLNLQYNKARQAGITNQIIEISAGAEALS